MISIIIPVYNDIRVEKTIQSIVHNNYEDYEIIIVDNNSSDKKIKAIADKYQVKYIKQEKPSSYIARNTGGFAAEGNILYFIDSDCILKNDALEQIEKSFSNNINGIMGSIKGINNNNIAELEQKFYEDVTKDFLNDKKKYLTRIDTRNFAISKKVFEKMQGFNEKLKFGGDMEFGARLHYNNYKIIYSKKIIVEHINEQKIYKIIKKRIKQNFDNFNITKYHDNNFIKKYFPHLLYFPNNWQAKILRYWFKLMLAINYPLVKINLSLLPAKARYNYFKGINILAIKYGLLSNVVGKKIKL